MIKHIVICADDYGQNLAISQAIIDLISKERISATSCMTTSKDWIQHASWLVPYQDKIMMGLHFNLTEGQPLTSGFNFLSLYHLIIKSTLRRLDQQAIEKECHAQIDQFVTAVGQLPDFIDGHQHIHQFPIIRDAVLNVYEQRLRKQGAYLRSVYEPSFPRQGAFLKKWVLQLTGAAFKECLVKEGIPHNTSFSGIYPFASAKKYAHYFPHFLHKIKEGGLIMCHPGLQQDSTANDPIAFSRFKEYQYFMSEKYIQACFAAQVRLSFRGERGQ